MFDFVWGSIFVFPSKIWLGKLKMLLFWNPLRFASHLNNVKHPQWKFGQLDYLVWLKLGCPKILRFRTLETLYFVVVWQILICIIPLWVSQTRPIKYHKYYNYCIRCIEVLARFNPSSSLHKLWNTLHDGDTDPLQCTRVSSWDIQYWVAMANPFSLAITFWLFNVGNLRSTISNI